MSADEHPLRIAAILGDVLLHPPERFRHVANEGAHVHVGQQPVVGGDENETFVHEPLRLELHVALVARLPPTAVNPEDDRKVLRVRWCINVEHLPLVAILDVRDVALRDSGLRLDLGEKRGGDEECGEVFHSSAA
jgi:hypothetical protein